MKIRLETERLILRNASTDDYQAAFKWCGDPVVNTYMIYPVYERAEDVKNWLSSLNHDDPDNAEVVFILKETGEIIGGGGIHYAADRGTWEVGYNLCREYWGRGYAPEAIQKLIDYVCSITEVKAVEATFCVENSKSCRVAEKLGMSYYEDTEYTKLDGSRTFKANIYRKVTKK